MAGVVRNAAVAMAALMAVAAMASAAPPPPSPITAERVAAAREEGIVAWYTAADLPVAEAVARDFQARYPGITVQVERTGSERVFQRLGQEYTAGIHAADVVSTSDGAHFIVWKRQGWLAPYVPEDAAKHFPPEHLDPDGTYATWWVNVSVIAYNTRLVRAEDAPKSFADLLDPKWSGKIVKSHPGYSGLILTATYEIARDLGWSYFESLAKQRVMQLQSSTDPPKRLVAGERAIMADGSEHVVLALKQQGAPIEIVYPTEGTPIVASPSAVLKDAPHPNAARLFQSYLFTVDAQQLIIDVGDVRSAHALAKEKPGRVPFKDIKTMREDPQAVETEVEEIKKRYTQYFHT